MKILDLVWRKMNSSIIVNCFAKAGILKERQKPAQLDDNHLFKAFQNQIEILSDFYALGTTAEDVTSGEENLMSTMLSSTDEDLIEEAMNSSNRYDEESDDMERFVGPSLF